MKTPKLTLPQLRRWVSKQQYAFRNGGGQKRSLSEKKDFEQTFGIGAGRRALLSYEDACRVVREADIKSVKEFYHWNRPVGMPSNPDRNYKDSGWAGWGKFFGTGFMSYEDACKTVRKAGIKTKESFRSWNRPVGMPSAPNKNYKDSGWSSWMNFLGTR